MARSPLAVTVDGGALALVLGVLVTAGRVAEATVVAQAFGALHDPSLGVEGAPVPVGASAAALARALLGAAAALADTPDEADRRAGEWCAVVALQLDVLRLAAEAEGAELAVASTGGEQGDLPDVRIVARSARRRRARSSGPDPDRHCVGSVGGCLRLNFRIEAEARVQPDAPAAPSTDDPITTSRGASTARGDS